MNSHETHKLPTSMDPFQAMKLSYHLFSTLLNIYLGTHKKSYTLLIPSLSTGATLSSMAAPMGNQQSKERDTALRRSVRSVTWLLLFGTYITVELLVVCYHSDSSNVNPPPTPCVIPRSLSSHYIILAVACSTFHQTKDSVHACAVSVSSSNLVSAWYISLLDHTPSDQPPTAIESKLCLIFMIALLCSANHVTVVVCVTSASVPS